MAVGGRFHCGKFYILPVKLIPFLIMCDTWATRNHFLPLWGWNTHWRNSIPNGHSQWAFGMILLPYLVKIAIYGTMHHVRCLATWPRNARHVLRHAHYMWRFPDYLPFIHLWNVAEIGSWTCVLEYDISYTRGHSFHHGTRQRLVPRWKFCPLV